MKLSLKKTLARIEKNRRKETGKIKIGQSRGL